MSDGTPVENWREIIKRPNQVLGSNRKYTVSGNRAFYVPSKDNLTRSSYGYVPSNNESNYNESENGMRRKDSLSSENRNFLKRIWLTARDITHRNEVANSIERYQKILQMPEDPEDLTINDLKLLVAPIGLNSKTRRWKNWFSGKSRFETVSGLRKKTKKNGKTYRSNRNRLFRNFEGKELLTEATLRSYKINAYNELLALMLILMEKAQDKFAHDNIFKKVGKKAAGWFTNDSGGVLHIDNLTEDYVYNILGYDLHPKIKKVFELMKKSQRESTELRISLFSFIVATISITLYIFTMTSLFIPSTSTEMYCPDGSPVSKIWSTGTCYSMKGTPYMCNKSSSTCFSPSGVAYKAATQIIRHAPYFALYPAEIALALSVTHGVSIGIWASYKLYVMQRGYRRGLLLKDIFVDIHKTIFNENNTLLFEDIQDELFIYNSLSQGEKDVLNNLSKITILSEDKMDFDKNVHDYITAFIEERKQHKIQILREIVEEIEESDNNSNAPVTDSRRAVAWTPQEYRRETVASSATARRATTRRATARPTARPTAINPTITAKASAAATVPYTATAR